MPLSLDGSSGITGAINVQSTGSVLAGVTTFAAGSASAPSITPSGDSNTGIFFPSADTIAFAEGGVESVRIDSSGRLILGTSSSVAVDVINSKAQIEHTDYDASLTVKRNSNGDGGPLQIFVKSRGTTNGSNAVVQNGDTLGQFRFFGTDGTDPAEGASIAAQVDGTPGNNDMPGRLVFSTTADGSSSPTERARIDSSGRLLVGTSSARSNFSSGFDSAALQIEGTGTNRRFSITGADNASVLILARQRSGSVGGNTVLNSGDLISSISFQGNDGTNFTEAAAITTVVDGTPGNNDMPGRLVFSTTADGASSPTERMRIASGGDVFIAKTAVDRSLKGFQYEFAGTVLTLTADDTRPLDINRQTNDGDLIRFFQANTQEGSISVSGTTVSYNGAHLSRWSQLPSGVERTEILRGTVLSNIDEMCEWGEEENEQLNRMKVSDVEGDKNVSGVFQDWDDDDDTYTNDFYCAMTGDFIIRIGSGVAVERGDLLMSAGDGTAKPQDDDIVRSKTVAKVTSTHVTCTYYDGSYCVPCVLMAC